MRGRFRIMRFLQRTGVVAVCLSTVAGCQSARFKEKQAERDEHIRHVAQWYQDGEAGRPARLDANWELMEAQRLKHVEQLDATTLLIKQTHIDDQEAWRDGKPARHDTVYSIFSGRPEHRRFYWHAVGY